MARRVFISYNYQDSQIAEALPGMRRNHLQQKPSRFVYVPGEAAKHDVHAFDSESRKVMQGCDAAVFLIGGESHYSPHLRQEAELAIARGLPIVVARLAGSGEAVPAPLTRFPLVEVSPGNLASELNHLERIRL